ncbi:hypothetical protein FRC07_014571, partial [Ceratobasidium sp. 392]
MKLHNPLKLSQSKREKKERSQYIGSSLTSSRAILDNISSWSNSNDRARPLVMKFHKEWRHDDCSVMRWYQQQTSSSTRFRSIEHRRSTEGPFFHEYLMPKLTDGAVCRVERMGDGSRTDAVRYIGCTANDLVQWLSPGDFAAFKAAGTFEIIAEVDLALEYDILDVLAVCYAIQSTKACRVYTLQRYNCYFLCLTVLTVLTRRVASWETIITSSDWDSSLTSSLVSLSNLPPEELQKHLILRIYALLNPGSSECSRSVIDALRVPLSSQAGAVASLNRSLSGTLWKSSWELAAHDGSLEATISALDVILS